MWARNKHMLEKDRIQRAETLEEKCVTDGCINKHEPNSQHCLVHGGNKGTESASSNLLRNYRLTKHASRCGELRHSSGLKDLRDEIAILRMMLEEKLNGIESTSEMILQSGAISDLIIKIEKIVTSCHKLEKDMDVTLDRTVVLNLADTIVAIISKHVEDKEAITDIVRELGEMFSKEVAKNPTDKNTKG